MAWEPTGQNSTGRRHSQQVRRGQWNPAQQADHRNARRRSCRRGQHQVRRRVQRLEVEVGLVEAVEDEPVGASRGPSRRDRLPSEEKKGTA